MVVVLVPVTLLLLVAACRVHIVIHIEAVDARSTSGTATTPSHIVLRRLLVLLVIISSNTTIL